MKATAVPYHHGALREALIRATESLLDEHGAEAFTLREVARRAGVSPAAPAHHFGDAAGLLTAVAEGGFAGLAQALQAADASGGADARAALRAQGVAYVRFAMAHPGRFRLMFRQGKLRDEPALHAQADAAFGVLLHGVCRAVGLDDAARMDDGHWRALTGLWSLVHGYAHLAIAGKLAPIAGEGDIDSFVQHSLGPILDAALLGLIGPPPRVRRATAARSASPSQPSRPTRR
jgi:AcrR family transcriptional regulator